MKSSFYPIRFGTLGIFALVFSWISCTPKIAPSQDTPPAQVIEAHTWRMIPGTQSTPVTRQAQIILLWQHSLPATDFAFLDQGQWLAVDPYSARRKEPSTAPSSRPSASGRDRYLLQPNQGAITAGDTLGLRIDYSRPQAPVTKGPASGRYLYYKIGTQPWSSMPIDSLTAVRDIVLP